jgi:anti-anti-sigma factor
MGMSPRPALSVTVQRGVRAATVRFDGELDIASDQQVARTLAVLLDEGHTVVLDLTDLRFCDIPGVRVLVEFSRAAAERGVEVAIRGATGQVARMLDLTRTRGVLPLVG